MLCTPARQCSKLSESYACKSHLRRKKKLKNTILKYKIDMQLCY